MFNHSWRLKINKSSRYVKCIAMGIALAAVAACSSPQQTPTEINNQNSVAAQPTHRVIAVDLVSVLTQLPGYETWSMTAQVSPATTEYGKALSVAMRDAGYGVQRVSADQGRNFLEYSKKVAVTDSNETTTFELQVRNVSVSRNYQWVGSRWIPSSAVRIQGVKPTQVNVYNDLHSKKGITTKLVTGVQFFDDSGRLIDSQTNTTQVSGKADELVEDQSVLNLGSASVFGRQRSNSDTRSFKPVSEVTLTFPTRDPSVLGELNKGAIQKLLEQMDASSDQLLIRGCSQGQSLAWDGTEVLSLERQLRINQELLVSGVNANSIRETGCIKDNQSLNLHPQSVRLTLLRATQPL